MLQFILCIKIFNSFNENNLLVTVAHNCHGNNKKKHFQYVSSHKKCFAHLEKKVYFQLKKVCLQGKKICSYKKKVFLHTQNKPTANNHGKLSREIAATNSDGKRTR